MSRGEMMLAADGHLCRSFGELAVENYLIAEGIEHQCEPAYPIHPVEPQRKAACRLAAARRSLGRVARGS